MYPRRAGLERGYVGIGRTCTVNEIYLLLMMIRWSGLEIRSDKLCEGKEGEV